MYITQKAIDIDEYLEIADRSSDGKSHGINAPHEDNQNKSAIAIKADQVRIVSRQAMKLVSGTDFQDSIGGDLPSYPGGIDLIGGNQKDNDNNSLVLGGSSTGSVS